MGDGHPPPPHGAQHLMKVAVVARAHLIDEVRQHVQLVQRDEALHAAVCAAGAQIGATALHLDRVTAVKGRHRCYEHSQIFVSSLLGGAL